MTCTAPFKLEVSGDDATLYIYKHSVDSSGKKSYSGLSTPAHYIEHPWSYYCGPKLTFLTSYKYFEPRYHCLREVRTEVWPAITWIPTSNITYGVEYNETIECDGALIVADNVGSIGMLTSWIVENIKLTLTGDIVGHDVDIKIDIPDAITFTSRVFDGEVQLYAQIPLGKITMDDKLGIFSINGDINFDILICPEEKSIKLQVGGDIKVSDTIHSDKSLGIDATIAIPLSPGAGFDLIYYLGDFIEESLDGGEEF
jgi:hypothetical protein